jgi:N-carbamoylputrescine amidase
VGVQICSDINRPEGSHALAAGGAMAILAPRATELRTYERWRVVFRANALTSAAYLLSVNRPRAEGGVLLGGPTIAVAPDGTVLLETTDPLAVVRLERGVVAAARRDYPGYLPIRARIYADAWDGIARGSG